MSNDQVPSAEYAKLAQRFALSVIHADRFVNVPHFAVKSGAERMIEQMGFSATILRPSYFIDNEHMIKDVILNHGVYPMPIGSKGVAMVDTRDIAEIAAIELIRREQAPGKLPLETITPASCPNGSPMKCA